MMSWKRLFGLAGGLLVSLFACAAAAHADQEVLLHSGNGPVGSSDGQVRVLSYGRMGNVTPAPADFANAQTAPFATVEERFFTYLPSLSTDPAAQWIAAAPGKPPVSALYAVPFSIADGNLTAASLDLRFAVDNALNGVFLNGAPITNNRLEGDYHSEFRIFRNDIAPLLRPGTTNWLYLNLSDYGSIAALMFSTTIRTVGGFQGITPDRGGNRGPVTVRIYGSGFPASPVAARLTAACQPDVVGIPPVLSARES